MNANKIIRISPEGRRSVAHSPSRAMSCANAPAVNNAAIPEAKRVFVRTGYPQGVTKNE